MVESLYGELGPERRAEFDAHLSECADCATLLNEFQRAAGVMSRRRRPDPGPEFWEGYWRRLEQRVAREGPIVVDAARFARRRSLGSWGYRVAAVVALLAAGAWIGRTMWAPSLDSRDPMVATTRADSTPRDFGGRAPVADAVDLPEVARTNRDPAPTAIDTPASDAPSENAPATNVRPEPSPAVLVSTDAERYIERSHLLLLAVLNGEPADSASFDTQKQRAGELVRVASSVRETSDDRRVQDLVAQLELILREIAHLEQSSDIEAVELIRSRVDREGVLLRINVEQMRSEGARGAID
jgi:Putative zinc-finger